MKVAAMEELLLDNIGELPGVGPITKLIKLIIKAASTARKQNRICRKFVQWLETIEGLLKPLLEVPNLMERPEMRKPLKRLEESLGLAYQLVIKYKDRSYPYRFIMGSDIAERFGDMRKEIKDYIGLIPLIKLFVDQTIIRRVDTRNQDNDREEEMDHNKGKNKFSDEMGLNKEEMGLKKGKNKEEEMNLNLKRGKKQEEEMSLNLKRGKKEEEEVKEKGRDQRKDMGNGKEEEKWTNREKDMGKGEEENQKKMKNAPPLMDTAVLKVAMRCECDGCPGRIKRSIIKYPGVEKVVKMELDEGIAGVTVVGHFDAKMLRDYVAKETKKEVHLVGNGGREREDHQVLEKTDHSKNIGGEGKPKGGTNNNKKRVVPMMVAATVVLKVGDTGLRCECNGCMDKICDTLFKITGVQKVGIDTDKNQVTVTGTNMDIKNLQEKLGNKVRRPVEVTQTGMMDGKD